MLLSKARAIIRCGANVLGRPHLGATRPCSQAFVKSEPGLTNRDLLHPKDLSWISNNKRGYDQLVDNAKFAR